MHQVITNNVVATNIYKFVTLVIHFKRNIYHSIDIVKHVFFSFTTKIKSYYFDFDLKYTHVMCMKVNNYKIHIEGGREREKVLFVILYDIFCS